MNRTAKFTLGVLGTIFCVFIGIVLVGVSISYWRMADYERCWIILLTAIPIDILMLSLCAGLASENQ